MRSVKSNPFYSLFPPKEGAKLFTSNTNISWFEEEHVFVSIPSGNATSMDLKGLTEDEENWREIFGERKIHWISVVDPTLKISKESKDYLATILPKYVLSLAMIGRTPLARVFANLFFAIYPTNFPTKMFANKEDALKWTKKQMSKRLH